MKAPTTCPKCGASYGASVIFCPNDGTVLDQSAGELTGKIIADRYRIISRIGEGGMGEVFLAEHVHMKRKCAVKMLNPELAGDAGAMKRFMREAANASRIDHPNVVTVYDFGEMPDRGAYLAMEFIEGESLRKRIERKTALPRDVMASILRQTASALQAAHALGIVHRDLKPDNIMLVERDGELRVKVVDFGIAKAKSDKTKVTATGAIVGTPDYMSPEQLMGDEVTGSADQYALALVAVKMLTGKLPFATTTSIESMTSRLTTAPMALRELRQDIAWPQPLQDCIGKALSSEPAQRYATVIEFSRAFDKAVGGMSGALAATVPDIRVSAVVAQAASSVMTQPTMEIRPSRFPLVAALVTIAVLGGGGAVWWANRGGSPTTVTEQPTPADSSGQPVASDSATRIAETVAPQVEPGPVVQTQGTPGAITPASPTASSASALAGETRPAPEPAPLNRDATSLRADTAAAVVPPPQPATPPPNVGTESRVIPETVVRPAAPRDTTPSGPPTLSTAEFTAEYSAIRALVAADATPAQLTSAVTRVNATLPKTATRGDSIRLLYVRAQAHAAQEDQPSACRTLSTALGIATGLSMEPVLKQTAQLLNCP